MRSTARFLLAAIAVILAGSAPGAAAVSLNAQGALRVICADGAGGKHPRRMVLEHVVEARPGATSALILLQYRSDGPGKTGRVKAKVELSDADGELVGAGNLNAPTDPGTASAAATDVIPADLGAAAAASFDLRFRRLGRLPAHDCIVVTAAVGAAEED